MHIGIMTSLSVGGRHTCALHKRRTMRPVYVAYAANAKFQYEKKSEGVLQGRSQNYLVEDHGILVDWHAFVDDLRN